MFESLLVVWTCAAITHHPHHFGSCLHFDTLWNSLLHFTDLFSLFLIFVTLLFYQYFTYQPLCFFCDLVDAADFICFSPPWHVIFVLHRCSRCHRRRILLLRVNLLQICINRTIDICLLFLCGNYKQVKGSQCL